MARTKRRDRRRDPRARARDALRSRAPARPAAVPYARLLSNGRYTVLVGAAGAGFSRCAGYALTRWDGDRTTDADGVVLYLRDLDRGETWSAGYQPVRRPAQRYAVRAAPGAVRFERRDHGIETRVEICVAPADDVEIRRVRLRNRSARPRRIELTSYVEIALIDPATYAAHPGFAKLFVQTEYVAGARALLARRRPRGNDERHPWLVHGLAGAGALEHESDRARFLGRGRGPAAPLALATRAPLSGTTGSVLDPIASMRRVLRLAPGASAEIVLLLGVAPSREAALRLASRYRKGATVAAAFAAAAAHERRTRRSLALAPRAAERYEAIAAGMLYGEPALRAPATTIARAAGSLGVLATYGLRADRPLALVHVRRAADRALVRDVLAARAYWRAKAVIVEVLLVCGGPAALAEEVRRLVEAASDGRGEGGAVAVVRRAEVPASRLAMIEAAAHLVLDPARSRRTGGAGGWPRVAVGRRDAAATRFVAAPAPTSGAAAADAGSESLRFWNGYGGFAAAGREYVLRLGTDAAGAVRRPPMPWVNVIANESFGFLVSESGAGCTWSRNSRLNRLTPWSNDPVQDPYGEAFYVRDEDAGVFWSPLPGPTPPGARFEVRHDLGTTTWIHESHGLAQEVCTFVPRGEPVRITRLRLTNLADRSRRLALFAYAQLVLGGAPAGSGRFVVTGFDRASSAVLARTVLGDELPPGVAFAAAVTSAATGPLRYTGDRTAFLGRHGALDAPAALARATRLDGRTGAALDPCAALQVAVTVRPGATVECVFLLGEAADAAGARDLVARYRRAGAVDDALAEARAFWAELADAVHIATPAPTIDLMVNGWLAYQAASCRLWGRSAFYQSGGAYGFRDQLQDAAAFALTHPSMTRAQILVHAAHQFDAGDVLHWWHPPRDRGMRTRFSDDLLWLPWISAGYVRTTGDWSVLDEQVRFVTARPLAPGEDEAYLAPEPAPEVADVYAHCCRALDRSLTRGQHGLPLMGTGDWNDGMNRVGREGRGESVWLGFFLVRVIEDFLPLCERRGDRVRAQRYRAYQADLRVALETAGWDGAWYRRAYYDDGTPLGSAMNEECRIDALAQAWAVLSGVAPPERAARALDAVDRMLVSREHGIIRLLAPPFDRDPHDPGYIKGYVPGIRENGGQYTHAALWVVQAYAELGRRADAAPLLEMLSPVSHAATREQADVYEVEPYVVVADVYGAAPHVGRGGWTWYTGAAGWMRQVALESILGVRVVGGDTLVVAPRVPDAWPRFSVRLRLPGDGTVYEIAVENPRGTAAVVVAVTLDGAPAPVADGAARVALARDGGRHQVVVTLGPTVRS